jgi:hypothetical protein
MKLPQIIINETKNLLMFKGRMVSRRRSWHISAVLPGSPFY